MQHSSIVGGSTAKRVINCPGSVALVAKMPPKPSSKYADEGTLLHNVIAEIVMSYCGMAYPASYISCEDFMVSFLLLKFPTVPDWL